MFRKYYKAAMNDIKPDEEFINSVIKNAKRQKPPMRNRYTRYAATAAAAVAIVSAAVISMPLWQKTTHDTDGVIIEEAVFPTVSPAADSAAALPVQTETPAAPAADKAENADTSEHSYTAPQKNSNAAGSSASQQQTRTEIPVVHQEENIQREIQASEIPPQIEEAAEADAAPSDTETAEEAGIEEPILMKSVADSDDYALNETESAPAVGAAPPSDAGADASAKRARVADTDIPAPTGYYCTSASPSGYTFVNDDGAVIIVAISYGGEESAPYYSEDGGSIYATVSSFGLTVTVNASGAERAVVEEIIESFR